MTDPRIELSVEDAERLLDALDWCEGEGQCAMTARERKLVHDSKCGIDWKVLDAANWRHGDLRGRLERFVEVGKKTLEEES